LSPEKLALINGDEYAALAARQQNVLPTAAFNTLFP
jgi:hypothetical protein